MEILKALNQNGKTIILITHDINIANQANRKVHIQDGKIVKDEKVGN
jgi:putative ABC transport system ATP-binding protein